MGRALVVNSHRGNEEAVRRLLASCSEYPDIIVVYGGHDADDVQIDDNITTVRVTHNSIDMNGLIALLDVPQLARESYFYVHDTCEAGPLFVKNVLDLPDHDTASFQYPSKNLGLYTWTALERHKDLALSFKNTDTTPCGIQVAKRDCVDREDAVFRANEALGLHAFIGGLHPTIETVSDVYGTGVQRRTNYYPTMDLYKYQANWTTRQEWELRL